MFRCVDAEQDRLRLGRCVQQAGLPKIRPALPSTIEAGKAILLPASLTHACEQALAEPDCFFCRSRADLWLSLAQEEKATMSETHHV